MGLQTNFQSPRTRADVDFVKRQGFHDQGILVADINDPKLSWPDRELLRTIGEKLYGKVKPA